MDRPTQQRGDLWKVDLAKHGRIQILLIVHELTLTTLVRRKTSFDTIEKHFWSTKRAPLRLRDQISEGQRITGYEIELLYVRPRWDNPDEQVENAIAKIRHIRSRDRWRLYWQRANLKWHPYAEHPIADTLSEALAVIREDRHGCFLG